MGLGKRGRRARRAPKGETQWSTRRVARRADRARVFLRGALPTGDPKTPSRVMCRTSWTLSDVEAESKAKRKEQRRRRASRPGGRPILVGRLSVCVFAFLGNRHCFRMEFRGDFELGQICEDRSQLTL